MMNDIEFKLVIQTIFRFLIFKITKNLTRQQLNLNKLIKVRIKQAK